MAHNPTDVATLWRTVGSLRQAKETPIAYYNGEADALAVKLTPLAYKLQAF